MTRVADTSFLFALFDAAEPEHARARTWAEDPEPIEVIPEVLGETLGVAHRRLGFAEAAFVWEQLRKLPQVEFLETTDVQATADAFEAGKGTLSWVDAAVVARCRAEGRTALTLDRAIHRALRG